MTDTFPCQVGVRRQLRGHLVQKLVEGGRGVLGCWRQEAQRRGDESSLKADSYLINQPVTHPAFVPQGVIHYSSNCQYTFWTVFQMLILLSQGPAPKYQWFSMKINQCFLHPNQKHLLGFLSNYLIGEMVDKHTFNHKEAYLFTFRGPESCVLIDKIMNLLIASRISWLNLCSFLHKLAKVRRENAQRQNDEPFDGACYQPGRGWVPPSYIPAHTRYCGLHMGSVAVGRFRFVFLSVFSSLKTHHLRFLEAIQKCYEIPNPLPSFGRLAVIFSGTDTILKKNTNARISSKERQKGTACFTCKPA